MISSTAFGTPHRRWPVNDPRRRRSGKRGPGYRHPSARTRTLRWQPSNHGSDPTPGRRTPANSSPAFTAGLKKGNGMTSPPPSNDRDPRHHRRTSHQSSSNGRNSTAPALAPPSPGKPRRSGTDSKTSGRSHPGRDRNDPQKSDQIGSFPRQPPPTGEAPDLGKP
jgi:hypothetical protein